MLPDSNHLLKKDEAGYWKINLPAAPGTRYQYRLDDGEPLPDPASFSQPEGVHGPSELIDPTHFAWTDEAWTGIPLANMIIYELHPGSFSQHHNFDGILQKLDYFLDLGINTIELMPLGQFPGERNWGYDGVFPFAVQNSYGGVAGFQRLVDAAHAKGIAIIIDVVYNHFGPEGNYVDQYGPYFTDKYHTPWGKAVNVDDAWADGVRHYFLQNARMWLEDYHVDGLRLDAVHAIKDFSAVHFMTQLKEQVIDIERRTLRKKELIAELDLNDPRYINPPGKGGYGLDGQWVDEFHHALHVLLTGEKNAYYEDFGDIHHLEKAFRDTYVYTGEYSPHRKRTFGTHVDNNPYSQFVVFSQNHDQIGNRAQGDRLTASLSLEQLKLAAATVLLSPSVPLLFMGEEYGELNPFPFFTSFTDPALIEAVRSGRKEEFAGFAAGHELPDPEATSTFETAVLSLDAHLDAWLNQPQPGVNTNPAPQSDSKAHSILPSTAAGRNHLILFRFYQYLIGFRKTRPAMAGITRDSLIVHPAQGPTLCFERKIPTDRLFISLNFSGETVRLPNPLTESLTKIFDSASPQWQPASSDNPTSTTQTESPIPPAATFEIAPWSAIIFEIDPATNPK